MKRFLISLGAFAAAAFSLTNCTQEFDQPVEAGNIPYTIYANAAETKTVNDGLSTKWAEGDQLNVFHAPAGTSDYSGNSLFTLVDAATGEFTTEALDGSLAATNDWYVLYPYSQFITTPAEKTDGYSYIGSRSDRTQTQNGNNSMTHIAGTDYPLWGTAKNVSNKTLPGLTMSHLSSLVEVVVTNNTAESLVVDNVVFTATESIVGTFYVDFTTDVPTLTDGNYVSNSASLKVNNGESISAGGNAKFYLAVKPFTASAGQLTLSVNGLEKTFDVSDAVTFASGKIKTLNFNYDKVTSVGIIDATVAQFLAAEVNALQYYRLTGTISNIQNTTYGNFDLIDETGTVYVYGLTATQVESNDKSFSTLGLKEGDIVTLIGTRAEYRGAAQVGGPAYYESHEPGEEPEPDPDPVTPLSVPATVDMKTFTPSESPSYITTNVAGVYGSNGENTGWKVDATDEYVQYFVSDWVGMVKVAAYGNSTSNSSLELLASATGDTFTSIDSKAIQTGVEISYEYAVSDKSYRYFKLLYHKGSGNLSLRTVEFVKSDTREQLATPSNLKAVVTDDAPNSITVSWDSVENATSYSVTCGDETKNTADLTCTFVGLDFNRTYSISVVANGDAASYKPSNAATTEATTLSDSNAGQKYLLVTDATSLKAGDQIVIACVEHKAAMGIQSGTIRVSVAATINNNELSGDGIEVLTLENGGVAGTFALKATNSYLYWDSGNSVKTGENSYDWNISNTDKEGIAKISSNATPERELQYNASSPRFACYKGTQIDVSLFKLVN